MPDISSLSDDELQKLLAQPHQPSLKSMSDDDLRRLLGPGSMTAGDYAADFAKSAAVGPAKAAVGLIGLPGDISTALTRGGDWLANKIGLPDRPAELKQWSEATRPPGSADVQRAVEGVTGEFYKPKSKLGEYAQTGTEFMTGAALGPGGLARNAVRFGLMPAVASETAVELPGIKGTSAEPWVRAGASLAGGGAGALLSRPATAERALAPALQNIDRQTLDAAQALMTEAAGRGINLSWPQAAAQVTDAAKPLQQMQRFVERTPTGGPSMASFYEGQPQAIHGAIDRELGNIAPPPPNPYVVGKQASDASRSAIENVNKTINDYTTNMYHNSRYGLVRGAELSDNPAYQHLWEGVRSDPIVGTHPPSGGNSGLLNYPPHSVAAIDAVKKVGDEMAQGMRASIDKPERYKASIIEQSTRGPVALARAQFPEYDNALGLQEFGRSQILEPLQQGPLGQVARAGSTEQATQALFGPKLAGGENQIRRAIVNMEGEQPGTGAALTRQYLADKANTAAANLVGGQNYYGGARFAKDLFGNPQSAADVRAAIEALPARNVTTINGPLGQTTVSIGPTGRDTMAGVDRLVEALRATGKRLPEGSQTATDLGMADAVKVARGPIESTLSVVGRPFQAVGKTVDDIYGGYRTRRTAGELARILQDPNEIELLARIAGQGRRGSSSAALLANALLAGQQSQQPSR